MDLQRCLHDGIIFTLLMPELESEATVLTALLFRKRTIYELIVLDVLFRVEAHLGQHEVGDLVRVLAR